MADLCEWCVDMDRKVIATRELNTVPLCPYHHYKAALALNHYRTAQGRKDPIPLPKEPHMADNTYVILNKDGNFLTPGLGWSEEYPDAWIIKSEDMTDTWEIFDDLPHSERPLKVIRNYGLITQRVMLTRNP